MKVGIVGMPNVGKSTLFNALTETAKAQAANYPFCTIEPNVGSVCVPDERLQKLALSAASQSIIPTHLTFVDIAGLVRGASQGEGLGNQFLSHIRSVDVILHVVRCFEDENIVHVEGSVQPLRDIETIETELMLADLSSLQQRLQRKKTDEWTPLLQKAYDVLKDGQRAISASWTEEEKTLWHRLDLLTLKPVIYVCNVAEKDNTPYSAEVNSWASQHGDRVLSLCNQWEAELMSLPEEEKIFFCSETGMVPGLDRIIRTSYDALERLTFFTVGPKETRAWTVKKGAKAPEAGSVIHTDFQRGFIRAEVVAYEDYIACGSLARLKESGKVRSEGREYVVQDGDVILFRFNV